LWRETAYASLLQFSPPFGTARSGVITWKSGVIRSDFEPQDVLLAVAASTWAFVNDGDWEERARRVLHLVMDGLRYKPR
jgi:hypothetical protein